MRVCRSVEEYRSACDALRAQGKRVGLVPTMGALHSAHAALMHQALQASDCLAVSLFVNPTQFGPQEDFSRYPRTWDEDRSLCEKMGASLLFAPNVREMYPSGEATRVRVRGLTESLCGAHRPGHFEGVATVVTKLFAATGPCLAVFGRKDFQQLQCIRRLVQDLLLPVEIHDAAIQREPDGLAISSRNRYLSPAERRWAARIPAALVRADALYGAGERSVERIEAAVPGALDTPEVAIEYAQVVYTDDLSPAHDLSTERSAGVFVAVRIGSTRLIDNLLLGVDDWPRTATLESVP